MIYESIAACIGHTPMVYLSRLFAHHDRAVIAKLEFLNPGGSVKDRPARFIIECGIQDGTIDRHTHLIESTSGNLGIALSMVARIYGLHFTCVVDPKISPANLRILTHFGAQIDMVHQPDDQGGYLKTRIRRVHELLEQIPGSFWINQYANQLNWQAHYHGTGGEILADLDCPIDYLVVAISTTGTILGLARRLRQAFPKLRVVAVDAVGSVIFGGPPARRELPGIGSSRVPELLCREEIDDVLYVSDREAVQGCRDLLLHEGIFAGGSSGAVVAGIRKLLQYIPKGSRILTLFPDRGERYLDLVYNDDWVATLARQDQQPIALGKPGVQVAGQRPFHLLS